MKEQSRDVETRQALKVVMEKNGLKLEQTRMVLQQMDPPTHDWGQIQVNRPFEGGRVE